MGVAMNPLPYERLLSEWMLDCLVYVLNVTGESKKILLLNCQ